jgi:hypothetical protein
LRDLNDAAGVTLDQFKADFLDIHNQRLSAMDANGVDFVRIYGVKTSL